MNNTVVDLFKNYTKLDKCTQNFLFKTFTIWGVNDYTESTKNKEKDGEYVFSATPKPTIPSVSSPLQGAAKYYVFLSPATATATTYKPGDRFDKSAYPYILELTNMFPAVDLTRYQSPGPFTGVVRSTDTIKGIFNAISTANNTPYEIIASKTHDPPINTYRSILSLVDFRDFKDEFAHAKSGGLSLSTMAGDERPTHDLAGGIEKRGEKYFKGKKPFAPRGCESIGLKGDDMRCEVDASTFVLKGDGLGFQRFIETLTDLEIYEKAIIESKLDPQRAQEILVMFKFKKIQKHIILHGVEVEATMFVDFAAWRSSLPGLFEVDVARKLSENAKLMRYLKGVCKFTEENPLIFEENNHLIRSISSSSGLPFASKNSTSSALVIHMQDMRSGQFGGGESPIDLSAVMRLNYGFNKLGRTKIQIPTYRALDSRIALMTGGGSSGDESPCIEQLEGMIHELNFIVNKLKEDGIFVINEEETRMIQQHIDDAKEVFAKMKKIIDKLYISAALSAYYKLAISGDGTIAPPGRISISSVPRVTQSTLETFDEDINRLREESQRFAHSISSEAQVQTEKLTITADKLKRLINIVSSMGFNATDKIQRVLAGHMRQ